MFGLEAAKLYVTVGVDGMDKYVSDMKRTETLVNQVGNSKATVTIEANTSAANARLDDLKAKYTSLGGSAHTIDLMLNPNPAMRALGEVSMRIDAIKGKMHSLASGGTFGTFGQDLSAGVGVKGALSGVMSKIGGGMATGGVGGGVQAGVASFGAGGVAALGLGALGIGALMKAGEQEKFQTQLSVLLGGMDEAKKRLAELTQFAATTPFELPEVVNASKTLQVFTGNALSTGKSLTMIGDVAAGTGSNFGETAMWFGRMYDAMKSGRPFGEATMRLQEMGAMGGKSREKIEELAAKVKDGSMTMAEAWKQAEGEFGRFGGMMEKQSQTFEGKLSNLKDAIGQSLGKLGVLLLPVAKIVIDAIILIVTAIGEFITNVAKIPGQIGDAIGAFIDWVAHIPFVADALDKISAAINFIGEVVGVVGQIVGTTVDHITGKYDEMAASAERTAQMTSSAWYKAFREGERDISAPAAAIANVLPHKMETARQRSVEIAKQSVVDISNALRDKRSEWQKAVDGLKYDLEHKMTTAAEIAAVKAELAAVNASKGWKSGDPVLIAALESTQEILQQRLGELAPAAGKKGKEAMDALGRILRSDPTAVNAAKYQAEKIEAVFLGMKGYEWGAGLIEQWLRGVDSKQAALVHKMRMMSGKIAAYLKLASPAKEGPLSEGGGPEGWGERGGELYAKGWSHVGHDLERSLRGIRLPSHDEHGNSAFGRSGGAGLHGADERANAVPHIGAIYVDARGATDPEGVRRAARRGVMDGVAEGYRQQNARLPQAVRA